LLLEDNTNKYYEGLQIGQKQKRISTYGPITLAKKCCLSLNEVKFWVSLRQQKRENCAKAVQRGKETRARKRQK